ncbi:hypothetical protein [Novipirellula artificiosorum]|uniref:Uncharacterized protein n=1 Tax=Novipirellula artificiosorum TaxID=2528016 RepID=A0A5C6DET4_9BACT|nr:hypothetical protein [Novipirellula artificiosorum]TWU34261.1 hypothetical protein Poly41_44080 [Novipirellula artificiosorum]
MKTFSQFLTQANSRHLLLEISMVAVTVTVALTGHGVAQEIAAGVGIASQYARDQGIEKHPSVVFAENFERRDLDAIGQRWETVRNPEIMSISDDVPAASSGKQSLLMSQTAETGTGADLYRRLDDGYDQLYTRMYVKFDEACEPVHHFGTCVGGNNPSTAWPSVRAGQPTAGDKSFWVGIEPFGKTWTWDYYAYWCEMRGSPPRGQTWGNKFIQDDSLSVLRGHWTCIEVMVRMNDVGETNGELALWIEGKPVSHLGKGFPSGKWVFDKFNPGQEGEGVRWNPKTGDREYFATSPGGDPFEGFRFRTAKALNVNFVWLYLYITKGTAGHVNRVWFDDVVVAKDYIGPIQTE